jgi:type IV secretory pathway VirB10-like protein
MVCGCGHITQHVAACQAAPVTFAITLVVCVPAGSDQFNTIVSPQTQLMPGSLKSVADVAALQQQWVAAAHALFPPRPSQAQEQQGKVPPQLDARYREEDVDTARARREAALEAYRREMEAIHRQEAAARKQKAVAAAAGGAGQGAAASRQQQQQQQQQRAVAAGARQGR